MTKTLCYGFTNVLSNEQTSLESTMLKESFVNNKDCTYQQESISQYCTKFSVRANNKLNANAFCGLFYVTWKAGENQCKFRKCTLK
jgi:hypothetical protein